MNTSDILTDEELNNVSYEDGVKAINNYFDNTENQETNSGSEQTPSVESTSAEPQQEQYGNQDYSKLFQPFKAGGKEVQIRNLDEAISLMQKGVDYTQKQQALKPRLNEMRALEQQGMLGENLNYAIDLYNGKPEAIAKLLKDRQVDINSILPKNEFGEPIAEDRPYIPTEYRLSEEQLKFQDVIDELRSTNSFDKVDSAVQGWDMSSKQEFVKDPQKLIALNEHIESGFYDTVMKELDHARLVGNPLIRGKNDFEAYTLIGEAMVRNAVASYQQPVSHQQQPVVQPQYQPQHQQNYQPTQRIQERKASVAPVRSAPQSRGWENFDPLAMSDEEFSKIDIKQLFKGV